MPFIYKHVVCVLICRIKAQMSALPLLTHTAMRMSGTCSGTFGMTDIHRLLRVNERRWREVGDNLPGTAYFHHPVPEGQGVIKRYTWAAVPLYRAVFSAAEAPEVMRLNAFHSSV